MVTGRCCIPVVHPKSRRICSIRSRGCLRHVLMPQVAADPFGIDISLELLTTLPLPPGLGATERGAAKGALCMCLGQHGLAAQCVCLKSGERSGQSEPRGRGPYLCRRSSGCKGDFRRIQSDPSRLKILRGEPGPALDAFQSGSANPFKSKSLSKGRGSLGKSPIPRRWSQKNRRSPQTMSRL